jgi:hypothetical protein
MRRIASIATHYPAISHTFVARELAGLRGVGSTFGRSRRGGRRSTNLLTEADTTEAARTCVLLPH